MDSSNASVALRRIDAIINCMGEGLIAIDNCNDVVLMNGVAEKITGVRFGECACMRLECCGMKKEVMEFLHSRLAETAPSQKNITLRIDTGEVDPRYYSVNIQDVVDDSGERIGRVILFMDQTAAKNMERLKESFLNLAAHELRTPINVMMNYISLIKEKSNGCDLIKVACGDMISANRRMKNIVNSIINFIALSSPDIQPSSTAVNVGSIIREEISKLETEANDKNLTFELTESLAKLQFISDPSLVSIAVSNVLSNAVKYNRENGTVRVNVKNKPFNGKPGIAIVVSDEGEGLPTGMEDCLFESFKQGEEHLTRYHCGLGNGLFLAQRAVRLLGGCLRAESLPERGSRFSLEFPCRRIIGAVRKTSSGENKSHTEEQ